MIPALPCGTYGEGDTPAGAFYVAAFEPGDAPHHVGEARFGDRQLGCIAVLPVGVE